METIKNIIIGFGKGGKTLAKFLAQKGEEVLVIEKSNKMYGGTCINIACLPSKRLIIEAANGVSYVDAVNGKNEMTAQLREKNYHMLADEKTVTVLDGEAHFIADHEIEVKLPNGKKAQYKGDRIFINTGAVPVMLPIPGLKESKYILDSTQAMDEKKMPKNLTIIGAGYIGLEFASMFAKYGSKVTVLDHNKEFLAREDEDISNAVRKDMEDAGIKFELGADIEKITDETSNAKITYQINEERKTISADRILVATGRKPNTENLGLENTAIETTDRGAIKVDDFLRTTVDNVWAIGDVKGGLQFTYISLDDFRIIKDQLFGTGARMVSDRKVVPYSVFISPALSQVGLNEKQANRLGKEYKLFKLPVTAIPKAKVAKDNRGLFKALVDPETEKILGATLYGIESYELINMISLAMKAHLSYAVLRDQIYTHPTMSEAFNDLFK
ncbi:pyridine nucleotide-disulfide oxidoreductase [Lactobacillus johnsonii]|jgi:pyruvate/2-oxoglutarate dehydrogenase complex dihydrolipoamide dehydrogenase (E3) component|uniref:FAD-dependent oxidoreductase n=1 Tax=Lactobacillus johnsonii TaxID=33959 RepID=UPI001072AD9B|nr:FAD-dependent oxidoreductase [Lactobacillus johnsonii]MBF0771422.1 FAD-dependent oxidoreductase [Lactobacillus johnsonii]MCF1583121.1 FAD-dependent oxidoreductase [Lactobacillus johnsonii]MCI9451789.1 FAD-dependent oxidoreductase [Lactobacillus johnsonii]MDG4988352.1 FAD-dependent oxidoreductase [Lactobacillus johnsonii]NDO44950.1 pyridine nucleotide-disulfide oxidoreductase [Lactobacillus johnsonii]